MRWNVTCIEMSQSRRLDEVRGFNIDFSPAVPKGIQRACQMTIGGSEREREGEAVSPASPCFPQSLSASLLHNTLHHAWEKEMRWNIYFLLQMITTIGLPRYGLATYRTGILLFLFPFSFETFIIYFPPYLMSLCDFLRLFHHTGWRPILEVTILFNFDTIQL